MYKDLKGLSLIEIGGDSCANCLAVMPRLKELADRLGLEFVKFDVEDDPSIITRFEVDRIPTIILADDGKQFAKCSGYQPQEILEVWLEAKLEDHKKKD